MGRIAAHKGRSRNPSTQGPWSRGLPSRGSGVRRQADPRAEISHRVQGLERDLSKPWQPLLASSFRICGHASRTQREPPAVAHVARACGKGCREESPTDERKSLPSGISRRRLWMTPGKPKAWLGLVLTKQCNAPALCGPNGFYGSAQSSATPDVPIRPLSGGLAIQARHRDLHALALEHCVCCSFLSLSLSLWEQSSAGSVRHLFVWRCLTQKKRAQVVDPGRVRDGEQAQR